jgi:putative CocE/NonD family hydrolase
MTYSFPTIAFTPCRCRSKCIRLPQIVVATLWLCSFAAAQPPAERVVNAWVPMRDGTKLATKIFLPPADGKYPVVLQRTPYNKEHWVGGHDMWTREGYVYVVQDTRGRFESEGTWYPFFQEKQDGYDTLAWIHQQQWCNGKVGMFGPSYNAIVQFAALQGGGGPMLQALMPTFVHGDAWERGWYSGGAFYLFNSVWWACTTAGRGDQRSSLGSIDLDKLYRKLPLITLNQQAGCTGAPFFSDIVTHYTHDEYWKSYGIHDDFDLFKVPTLWVGGWYDYYASDTFLSYNGVVEHAPNPDIARSHKVIIGPWGHHHGMSAKAKVGDRDFGKSELDFGPESAFDPDKLYLEWFDRTLKGKRQNGTDAPIRIFVMGANRWRSENEWPLARTQFTKFYLQSGGHANTLNGDGGLAQQQPAEQRPDRYIYDPADPVPTRGGNLSVGPTPAILNILWAGPADQRPVEARQDVLSYTSAPLESDMEVTGPVKLVLSAASSALDTDFVARLSDVYPNGRAINITEGILRARFRNKELWEKPRLIEPGVIYEYDIELQATSNVFKEGHQLRLDITSSSFPLWDRNLNTGHLPWLDTEMRKAEQTIYHNPQNNSYLVLPIIPAN